MVTVMNTTRVVVTMKHAGKNPSLVQFTQAMFEGVDFINSFTHFTFF